MAGNDTAALVVALSAQLSKFEKDMKGAVDIADKRTKEIETRFTAMNTAITNKLSAIGSTASGNIGFAGQLLGTLGPVGIAAAVGIGATVGAFLALANATAEFAEKAKRLKDVSETVGLTTNQFKQLGSAGAKVGLDFDETSAFFSKFFANLEALRDGSGPLFDALLRVDSGLLRQLAATRDSVKAVDLLVAAFARLKDQTERLDLAKAVGGRGGLAGVRLLDSLGKQGGLSGVIANNPSIDEGQIERIAKLSREIEEIRKKTANIWGAMFSDEILQLQKSAEERLQAIAKWVQGIADNVRPAIRGLSKLIGVSNTTEAPPSNRLKLTVTPLEQPKPAADKPSASIELAILQKNISLLGEAVTAGEQYRLKKLEIAAAAEKGGLMEGVAERALAAFTLTMRASALATRERIGVATEQEIVEVKLAQLAQDRAKFGLTENEVQRATVVILREAKQAADALTVRQSYLPGLTQLSLDAQNVRKQLDDLSVSTANTLTEGFADIVTKTKTVSEAFKSMADSIIRDIARVLIKQTLIGPITGAIAGAFGGGSGSPLGFVNQGFGNVPTFGARASGGPVTAGQPYVVGERGKELFLPRTSGTVIPNDKLSPNITVAPSVNLIVNNQAGVQVEASKPQRNSSGGVDLQTIIRDTVRGEMANGGFDSALAGRYGVGTAGTRR